jgi:RND family efflux transporter MFP subunit
MHFFPGRPSALLSVLAVSVLIAAGVLLAGCGGESSAEGTAADSTAANDGAKSGLAAYDENGDGVVYQGGMHPDVIEDEPGNCPVCGMKLNPTRVDGSGEEGSVKISPVTMQNMGVRTTTVEVAALGREIQATGRFEASEQGMTAVSPKVSGWVENLYVNYEGDRVREGQPLMEIYSPQLVSTQEEYLLALRNAERMRGGPSASSAASADRLVEAARRRLAYWDISSEQIQKLKATGEPTKTLTLYAPASGTVGRKNVTEGQQIRAGETLMHLTDLNPLWLMLDVYEQDLSAVEVGTPVVIDLPYAAGQKRRERVDYIYDEVDIGSRTVRARVTVPNPRLKLKPGMYAEAVIEGERAEPRPVVPTEAVVSGGGRDVVIEALGEGRFRPVPVRTGVASGDRVQILSGLEGGERIVTSAQFLIDSEARLQSALGAME